MQWKVTSAVIVASCLVALPVSAVEVHIRRLRKALNANGDSDVIRIVRAAGYALDSSGDHAI
jgi:DNA-binding winged helix-turn-helix (wHTH) protein